MPHAPHAALCRELLSFHDRNIGVRTQLSNLNLGVNSAQHDYDDVTVQALYLAANHLKHALRETKQAERYLVEAVESHLAHARTVRGVA